MVTNQQIGFKGEKMAQAVLKKHFTQVRYHKHNSDPFDYIATDKLTGEKVAIEVKTIRKEVYGKLVHIEQTAMNRKLEFLNQHNMKGIVLLVVINGTTEYFLAKLQNHISKGALVELK